MLPRGLVVGVAPPDVAFDMTAGGLPAVSRGRHTAFPWPQLQTRGGLPIVGLATPAAWSGAVGGFCGRMGLFDASPPPLILLPINANTGFFKKTACLGAPRKAVVPPPSGAGFAASSPPRAWRAAELRPGVAICSPGTATGSRQG